MKRLSQAVALLIPLLLVPAACSGVGLLYGFAGDYVHARAASFLDLDEPEDQFVALKVDDLMAWHRTRMLPDYAQFLRRLADRVEQDSITREAIHLAVAEVQDLYAATVHGAMPHVAAVLVRHTTPARVAHLRARIEDRNREHEAELKAPPADRAADRIDRISGRFERFIGDLTPAQRAIVETYVRGSQASGSVWRENRRRQNETFLAFMESRPDEAGIAAFTETLLTEPQRVVEGYVPFSDDRQRRFEALLYDVLSTMTGAQKRTAIDTLRGYADDLAALAT